MERHPFKASFAPPPSLNNQQKHETKLKKIILKVMKPTIVGYMSVDVMREYHHDLSQLKYLTSIPKGRLHFDLNHNIDKAVKRMTDENNEKINLLLKFILNQKHRLNTLYDGNLIFVTYRRSLISVMCNTYDSSPVSIVASLFNNCIYLCSLESPEEASRRNTYMDKYCAWGYKFEQYMLSDAPNLKPDKEKPVIENEEFSLYYYSEVGSHKLFYGAQIDGLMTVDQKIKVPCTENVEANLRFLKKNHFVELKTNKKIRNRQQELNFKRYKLLRCWCQCYLAGLKGLLVGYRNDDGVIQKVKWFDTAAIEKYCKGVWAPQYLMNTLHNFLSFVKKSFNSIRASGGDCGTKPLTLKFNIDERHRFSVTKVDDENPYFQILPSWYIDLLKT